MHYLLTILLSIPIILYSQSCQDDKGRTIIIEYEDLGFNIFPERKVPFEDTILKDSITTVIKLLDCMGKANFTSYSDRQMTNVIMKGEYASSLAVLRRHEIDINAVTGEELMAYTTFYQALKDGEWVFYDEEGKFLRKEKYNRGIKVSESEQE